MLSPGTRVRRYEVSGPLGAGGMGEVYLARDVELDRTVALKILPSDGTSADPERVRRFMQEARAAIALSHPHVAHIYDVGEDNGVRFMAMEYVEGETLRARMQRAVPLEEAVDIAHQVALALASAHAAGIVHRDIKPENVMLRPDGYVKVLDFGLAKLTVATTPGATAVINTEPGLVMGTMQYMSPEQLKGGDVDARSDVFSLGVVLYELVSGHRPFEASTPSGVIAAILTEEPPPIEHAPLEVRGVVEKALAKKPEERFASAREMAAALKKTRQQESLRIPSGDMPTQVLTSAPAPKRRVRPAWWIAAALLAIALGAGGWWWTRTQRIAEARAALPKIEQLAEQHRYFEAWDLAKSIEPLVGGEPQFIRALDKASIKFSATSEPPGAQVFLRRVLPSGEVGERVAAGVTPIKEHPVARGDYVVTYEKEGFATVERPFAGAPLLVNGQDMPLPRSPTDVKLVKQSETPDGMVLVEGGPHRLTGWMYTSHEAVPLVPFLIDKHEVSNAQFEQFIRAGGYRRSDLWKHDFVKDGKRLTFDEAMALFRDTTGLPGPRSWAQGKYPQGRENHPVTDISWYEAAAFAEHAGKKLPTIFQWDKAARNGRRSPFGSVFPWGVVPLGVDVTRRANFRGAGPMPVDSLPSGVSAWGVHHLAGNVAEWLRNSNDDGMATTGGSFDDPTYMFGRVGSYPRSFAGPQVGFRCVREAVANAGEQGSFALSGDAKPPVYTPASDAEFERTSRLYEYDRSAPLNVRQLERLDTPDWVREKFSFAGANGQTAFAYLYLPKGAQPPFQVLHFVPPADVAAGLRPLDASAERVLGGAIRGGRAVFAVVLEGYIGRPRPSGSVVVNTSSVDPTSELIQHTTDLRRGLDVLESRKDIDLAHLGFYGPSAGSSMGFIVCAVDDRYDAVIVTGTGLSPSVARDPSFVMRINFIPHIRAAKLMIHGKYDEANPWKSHAAPLFALMQENKELIFFDGGHIPDSNWLMVTLGKWLDEHFGPAR